MVMAGRTGVFCKCPKWPPERLKKFRKEVTEIPYLRQMENRAIGAASQFMPMDKVRRVPGALHRPACVVRGRTLRRGPRAALPGSLPAATYGMTKKRGGAETAFFVLAPRPRWLLPRPPHPQRALGRNTHLCPSPLRPGALRGQRVALRDQRRAGARCRNGRGSGSPHGGDRGEGRAEEGEVPRARGCGG